MYRFTTTMTICALALGFQSAHAVAPQDEPSAVVRFADLDLSRSESVAALYRRLQGAAETVCARLDDHEGLRHMHYETCVQRTISAAVVKVDRPALTAFHEAKMNARNATTKVVQK